MKSTNLTRAQAAAIIAVLCAPIGSPDDAMNRGPMISLESAGLEESGHLHDGSNGMVQVIAQWSDGEDSRYESY